MLVFAGHMEEAAALAIWADHPGLARFARNYFEYLWRDSMSYA